MIDADTLRGRLQFGLNTTGVVGAAIAVLHGGQVASAAAGVANLRTGLEVTPDTIFPIGSTTKSFTAALALELAEDPDTPVDEPGVTLRHVLSHTSGLDNGPYVDNGADDGCLERAVSELAAIPRISEPSARFGYSNAGYLLAGRVIEQRTGTSWDHAVRERLLEPAGLASACSLPQDAIRRRVAVGHVDAATPLPYWVQGRAMGPAGGTLAMSADDLLQWARVHLDGGGTVLRPETVELMQAHAATPPPNPYARGWGLGWLLDDWHGHKVVGHDGASTGSSNLRFLPDMGLAIVLLTNTPLRMPLLYEAIVPQLVRELAGVEVTSPLHARLDGDVVTPEQVAGTYERHGVRYKVEVRERGLAITVEQPAQRVGRVESPPSTATFGIGHAFGGTYRIEGTDTGVVVFDDDLVYVGGMFAARRVSD